MLAFVLPPEEAQSSLVRSIEFSARLKAGGAAPLGGGVRQIS
jgi:hypothetical protein